MVRSEDPLEVSPLSGDQVLLGEPEVGVALLVELLEEEEEEEEEEREEEERRGNNSHQVGKRR